MVAVVSEPHKGVNFKFDTKISLGDIFDWATALSCARCSAKLLKKIFMPIKMTMAEMKMNLSIFPMTFIFSQSHRCGALIEAMLYVGN